MSEQKPYPSILQGFGVILLFLGYTLLLVLATGLMGVQIDFNFNKLSEENIIIEFVLYILLMGAVTLTAYRLRKKSGVDSSIGFKSVSIRIVLIAIIILACESYLKEIIWYIMPTTGYFKESLDELLAVTMRNDVLSVILIVVAAPILEELLLRGIILDGFLKRYSPLVAIVCSAFIFGIIHVNPWQVIDSFIGGLILGWLYWKTNSLLLCIILHALNNLAAILATPYMVTDDISIIDSIGLVNYFLIFIPVILLFVFSLRYVDKHSKRDKAPLITSTDTLA